MAVRMFAAIDVGSFALELGIYEISDKTGIRNVEHIRHVIALGSDTFSEGKISYDLVDEMCRVLEKFTETMKMYRSLHSALPVQRLRCCTAPVPYHFRQVGLL